MSARQSVEEMVLKSNQLGGQGSTQHQKFNAWLNRSKCLVTPFWIGQYSNKNVVCALGISKTTKAYLLAREYTFSYSPLVLWWPPLSHSEGKRVFFLTSPWLQHLFKITYNCPNTVKRALRQGSCQFLPCCNSNLQRPLRSEALLELLWLGRGLEWACKVMSSCIPRPK